MENIFHCLSLTFPIIYFILYALSFIPFDNDRIVSYYALKLIIKFIKVVIMRIAIIVIIFIFLNIPEVSYTQVETKETKKTVSEQKGDTTVTKSVIISESENITPRHNMIVINPLKFLLFYNISYFHRVSPTVAIGAGVQLPTLNGINGIGFNAETRFHPSAKTLRGFYFAPNISYNRLWGDNSDKGISALSVGGLIGWQWFVGDDFAIGLGIGIDYYFASENDDEFGKYHGTAPALRFDIGYGW